MKENSLSRYSVDPQAEAKFLGELPREDAIKRVERNFASYENEVLRDEPVSISYSYWFGSDGELYNHSSLRPEDLTEKGFKPGEREGKYIEGFHLMTALLQSRPDEAILWYSPPGKAAFTDDPDNEFSQIKFIYGQLYIQYFDGYKINAVAVKVNQEEVLEELAPSLQLRTAHLLTERQRTYFFLRHPLATDVNIEDFLNTTHKNVEVYKDKEGRMHYLNEILQQIRAALFEKTGLSDSTSQAIKNLESVGLTEENIFKSYLSLINWEMERTGKSYIQLAGSCGGRTVTRNSVLSLLGLESPLQNLYSSGLRGLSEENNSRHYPDYECPHCHKILSGESKSDQSSWRKKCDHCGEALNC